jgi:hypothetical protein
VASLRDAVRRTFSWKQVKRSLLSATFVGTIVNANNQGPEVAAGHWPVLWKVGFTYVVPFLVVSYGTFAAPAKRTPWEGPSSHGR